MSKNFNNRTVSVIIPVYNKEDYIKDCVESILRQSYRDVEIILVDDCSTDNSPNIISELISENDNIIYYRQPKNQGAAVARNIAISLASGRYVAFLDADDLWLPNKLEMQLNFMKENNAAFSCTALECINKYGITQGSIRHVKKIITYRLILTNTMIATSTVIVDREIVGDFRMPLRRGGQDYATWLSLMKDNVPCWGLDKILTQYRVLDNSLSSNKFKSIRQVWEIQTHDENINRILVFKNLIFFIINAIKKHYFAPNS